MAKDRPAPESAAGPGRSGAAILVVDDDEAVRRMLRTNLESQGFRLFEAATGADALRLAADYAPDFVLLDLGLPDRDGVEVCRALRAWYAGPIVVISAREQEAQKVEALDAGADDYLTKPFGMLELQARIRAGLRRATAPEGEAPAQVFESGPLKADLVSRRVWSAGKEVHLTPLEFKLLAALIHHAGRIVTQKKLLETVWGPHSLTQTHYLRVYMTFLRRKLEPDPLHPVLFRTEAGVGYGLNVDAE